MRKVLFVCALLLAFMPLAPASAHDQIVSTDPAEGARLDKAPTQVTFNFNETLKDPAYGGANVAGKTYSLNGTINGTSLVVDTSKIAAEVPGSADWTVSYQVVSADGHPVNGVVHFTVANSEAAASASPSASAKPATSSAPAKGTSNGLGAWWWILGAVAVVAVSLALPLARSRKRAGSGDDNHDES